MINSFDINAIVDSKIKELKTAQPKIKLLTSTLKDIVEAIDNAILDIKNKIVDDKSMKAVHNNIAKLMGKSGIGGIIEQLSTMSYSKIVSRFNEETIMLFDSLHKFIDNAASISPEKISENMSGVNMLLRYIKSTFKKLSTVAVMSVGALAGVAGISAVVVAITGALTYMSILIPISFAASKSAKYLAMTFTDIKTLAKDIFKASFIAKRAYKGLTVINPMLRLIKDSLNTISKIKDDDVSHAMDVLFGGRKFFGLSSERKGGMFQVVNALYELGLLICKLGLIAVLASAGITAARLIIGGIGTIAKTVMRINKTLKLTKLISFKLKMSLLISSLAAITTSILILGAAAILAIPAVLLITGFMLGFWLLTVVIRQIGKHFLATFKGVTAIMLTSIALIGAAASLMMASTLLVDVDFAAILLTIGSIVVLSVMMILIGKFAANILKGTLALILITASLYIVALTIKEMMDAAEGITLENTLSFFGVLTAMVGSVIALGALVSTPPVLLFTAVGSVTLLALAGVFIAVAHSIKKMNEAAEGMNTDTISIMSDAIKSMISTIAGISLKDLAKAGIAGAALTPFLLMIGLLGSTMASIANLTMPIEFDENGKPIGFKQMNPDDFAMVSTNVGYMIDTLTGAIDKIGQIGSMQMLKATAMSAMMTIILLPISAMVSVISSIANLKFATKWDKDGNPIEYEELTPDKLSQVKDNVALIVDAMVNAIASLSDKISIGETLKNSIIMTLMGTCVEPVAGMVKTISDVAQGRIATEWDKDGNPTKWVSFSDIDFNKVSANIQSCLTSYVNALKNSGLEDDSSFFGEDGPLAKAKKGIALIAEVTEPVSLMIDAVLKTQESASKYDLTKLAFKDVLAQYKEGMKVFEDVDADSIKDTIQAYSSFNTTLDKILKIDEKAVKNNKEFVDNNIKLLDKINTLKVDNIKGVTDMFAKMADFSKTINGNFSKLAEAFSEELIKALNKLSDAIQGGFDTNVSVSTPAVSSSTPVQNVKSAVKPEDINNIIKSINDLKDVLQKPIQVTNNPTKPLIVANRNI